MANPFFIFTLAFPLQTDAQASGTLKGQVISQEEGAMEGLVVSVKRDASMWTGRVTTDHVVRLNPKTAEIVEYLLPKSTNIRKMFVDNSTTPIAFWIGSSHGGAIPKVEPPD